MARSTRNGELDLDDLPAGHKAFKVINTTIRDSLGAYCVAGEMAVLNKRDATAYLKKNMIQVALPEFEDENADTTATAKRPTAKRPTLAASVSVDQGQGSEVDTVDGI